MDIPWAQPYISGEELEKVTDCFKSGWLSMGSKVEKFEQSLAEYVGVSGAIAVNSGTSALDVALKAIGVEPRDEVIIPAMTYIATANAVKYQHAKPVLADIKLDTYNVDPEAVREKITEDTKAILPIDYGGQCADYDALQDIADDNDLYLVGDTAEGLSAEQNGRKAGALADISITSFHAAKLITSVEGGMIFTDDPELERRCRILLNQGEDPNQKYNHVMLGHNYRMSDLHASVGLAQFNKLEEISKKRKEIATIYTELLQDYSDAITIPQVKPKNDHAWFLYSILISERDQIQADLKENGIDTRITWPKAVHQQPLYENTYPGQSYPNSEEFANKVLSLPMYHEMSKEKQEYIAQHLLNSLEVHSSA